MASICGSPVCVGGKPKMKFTYTGDYVVRKDGVVELLTSGTLVFINPAVIDLFMVGGGGSGYSLISARKWAGPGGGGGTALAPPESVRLRTSTPGAERCAGAHHSDQQRSP